MSGVKQVTRAVEYAVFPGSNVGQHIFDRPVAETIFVEHIGLAQSFDGGYYLGPVLFQLTFDLFRIDRTIQRLSPHMNFLGVLAFMIYHNVNDVTADGDDLLAAGVTHINLFVIKAGDDV